MAESYRGLTIRIGGDTTELQKALRASNSAISGTQSELRKLGQALKLDPDNLEAYNLQMGYMANQAANTAMKLSQMQDAVRQVGERKVSLVDGDETTVRELAKATEEFSGDVENAALKAAQARAEFNQLVATLGTMHNEVTELSGKLATLESDKLARAFDLADGKKSVEEIREELSKAFKGISTSDLENRIKEIEKLAVAFDFNEVFDLSEGKVDVDAIRESLAEIPENVRPGTQAVDEFVAKLEAMNSKYAESRAELAKIAQERKEALSANDTKFADDLGTRFARIGQQYQEAMQGVEDKTAQAKIADKFTEKFQAAFMKLESSSSSSAERISRKYDAQMDAAAKKSAEVLDSIRGEYATARDELGTLTGTVFNFDSKNTDPSQMKAALEDIRKSLEGMASDLGLSKDEIEAFIKNVESLQGKFRDADTELKKWNLVQEFQDLVVETVKGEASINQMSRVMANMKEPSNLMRGMSELVQTSKVLEESYKTLMQTGKSLSDALRLNPDNSEAATQAMNAYSAAELVATENMAKLQQRLSEFDASKIESATDHTKSAAKQLLDAEKAAQSASTAYAKAQGNVERLQYVIDIINGKADEVLSGVGKDAFDNLKNAADLTTLNEAQQELAEYQAEVAKLAQTRKEAFATLELSKQRSEYESAKAGVEQWTSAMLEARNAQIELSKQSAVSATFGDTSDIDKLGQELDEAVKKANALKAMLEHDPTNMGIASEKMRAFADVTSLAEKRTEAINSRLSNLDTSRIDKMRESYGTAGNAMVQTEKAASDLSRSVEVARQKLNALTSGSLFDGIREDVRDTSKELGVTLPSNVQQARDELVRLEAAFKAALSDVSDASVLSFFDELKGKLIETANTAESVNWAPDLDEAAFQETISRISQLAKQLGQEMIQSANEIDTAYRDMRKTVTGTEADFQSIRDEAIKFSQTHFTSADTILEMEALGGQLGIATSALADFGEVASNLDIATDIQAEDIALQLGQIKNVMSDMDDSKFVNFADALVRLGNTTATTESAIMNVAQRLSAVANVTSMSTPELLAFSAAIASTGQRSESAATAISNTITGIGKAVAKGGADLENFAAIAGMSAEEFENAWKTSSADALEAFVKGLGTLTDDSTAAIAALDSMGISSVRQENALLALSQTIENVDAAMNNATEAWNGGGDAAREAAQKSEGFSGALGILQNNAQNAAASLGEVLIPFMKAISGALALVTDALNTMPGPLKATVVEVGGLSIAFAALDAVLKGLGLNGIASTITSLGALIAQEGLATVATNVLSAALSSIPVIGWVAGVVTAINMLGEQMSSAAEHTKLLSDATNGLKNAHNQLELSYAETSNVSKSLDDLKAEHEEALRSVADFGDKMRETWSGLGTDAAMADSYAATIKELGNQGDITKGEMEQLKDAVSRYNSITGAAISVTNEQTGELNIQASAIDDVTEAYKRNAEAKAYSDLLDEATRKKIENQQELARVTEELDAMTAKYGIDLGNEYTFMLWNVNEARELEQAKSDLTKTNEELDKTIEDLSSHIAESARGIDDYSTALVSAGMDTNEFTSLTDEEKRKIDEVQAALVDAGYSLTQYGSLNASQLKQIASTWNLNVNDIIALIKKLKSETASVSAPTNDYVEESKKLKEVLEDQYDEQKRLYGRAYDEQKKAYDREYDEKKKLLDREYDDQKKAYDREYDNLKKQLDREYDLEKDAEDKKYNEQKKQYDKDYDALKKQLDKEYDAQKKANDKALKDFKKTQDEEVEAFKDATDERLEALEDEYEAKKKLLNAEYESKDSRYDDAIAAIEAEQEAEDAARKKAEQDAKTAELQDAVAKARTNKARREAEEELKEHLEDIAYEEVEAQRDAAIEELKAKKEALREQLDDREEALKNSYDDAVDAYKKEREAKLKILQESNELEYDAYKEMLDAQLLATKEAHDTELTSLKDQQEKNLLAMKENSDAYLLTVKDGHDATLLAMKDDHDAALLSMKDTHDAALLSMKDMSDASLLSIKDSHDADLRAMKDEHEAMVESVKNGAMTMEEALGEEAQAAADANATVADAAAQATDSSTQAMTNSVQGASTSIETVMQKAISAFKEASSGEGGFVSGFAAMIKVFTDELPEAAGVGGDSMAKQLHSQFVTSMQDGNFSGAVQTLVELFSMTLPDAAGVGGSAMAQKLHSKFTEQMSDGNFTGAVQTLIDMFSLTLPEAAGTGGSAMAQKLHSKFVEQMDDGNFTGAMETLAKLFVVTLPEAAGTGGDAMAQKLYSKFVEQLNGGDFAGAMETLSDVFVKKIPEAAGVGGTASADNLMSNLTADTTESMGGFIEWLLKLFGVELPDKLGEASETVGSTVDSRLAKGVTKDNKFGETVAKTAEIASKTLGKSDWAKTSGRNMMVNFINGIISQFAPLANTVAKVAGLVASYLHHSVPDVGPLSDDDQWGYDFMQNFIDGIDRQMRTLASSTGRVAQVISDSMSGVNGGDFMSSFGYALTSDTSRLMEQARQIAERTGASMEDQQVGKQFADYLMQQATDTLKSKQAELYSQAQMMARIVEQGFDPRLSVDAAFEAIDDINQGELRRLQASTPAQQIDNSTYAPVINISIPGVVVREEADIDRLSQQIALRVQRSLNARIG